MNLRMPALKACLEGAGFTDVHTLLSSGNVVFSARRTSPAALERRIEAAMRERLGQVFMVMVRGDEALAALLAADPYRAFRLSADAKRIVTFLRSAPASAPKLPVELGGARLLCLRGTEVLGSYVPNPRGPVFMSLIEKTLGRDVTTRTWDTVRKVEASLPGAPQRSASRK
jgi:uncharacterized protein (DUF1697 family)